MTTAAETAAAPDRAARKRLALVALCLAFFVVQLDATVVNVALEAIRKDVGGSPALTQWLVDAYTVVLAAGMLAAGSCGDRYGARRVCTAGLVVFGVASVACSLAPSAGLLVAARAVQGAGAAMLLPSSLALIVDRFPAGRERGRALGVWAGFGSLGMAAGPLVGGTLIAVVGWRAVFWINVPVCLAAALLMLYAVDRQEPQPAMRLDPPGFALGTVALAAFTAGLIELGGAPPSPLVPAGLLALGVLAGIAFAVVELRSAHPMLDVRVFRTAPYSAAVGAGFLFNFGLYGVLLVLSLYLQSGRGLSPFVTGLLILPLTVTVGAGSTSSGFLTGRYGPRTPMLAGYVLGGLGTIVLGAGAAAGSLPLVVAGAAVVGLCSLAMPAMTSVAMSRYPQGADGGQTGLASGVLNTARQSGGALGVAVLGSAFNAGRGAGAVVPAMGVALAGYAVAVACTVAANRRSP